MYPRDRLFSFLTVVATLGLTTSAEAVSFRIVDQVVQPGRTSVNLHVVVDPEGMTLDGLQFGVEVDGGAVVDFVETQPTWSNLVTRGMGTEVAIPTAVAGGFTYQVDLDPEDQFSFSGSAPFPVALISIGLPTGTTEGQTFTVRLTSDLGSPGVVIGFFTGAVFSPKVDTTNATIYVSDQSRDFAVPGPADLFSSGHWDPIGIPQRSDILAIRNDGVAEANGGLLKADRLVVGDIEGSGAVTLANTDLNLLDDLKVMGKEDVNLVGTHVLSGSVTATRASTFEILDTDVGKVRPGVEIEGVPPEIDLTVTADLVVDQVDHIAILNDMAQSTVESFGGGTFLGAIVDMDSSLQITDAEHLVVREDWEIGRIRGDAAENSADIRVEASTLVADVSEVLVGEDLEVVRRGVCNSSSGVTTGLVELVAWTELRRVDSMAVGEDIELVSYFGCGKESTTMGATVTFEEIGTLRVTSDLEIAAGTVKGSGVVDLDAEVIFRQVDSFTLFGDYEIGSTFVAPTSTDVLNSDSTMLFEDVAELSVADAFQVASLIWQETPDPLFTATTNASTTLARVRGEVGSILVVGGLSDGTFDDSSGVRDTMVGRNVSGVLNLERSSLIVPRVWIGLLEPTTIGNPTGRLSLSGHLATNLLELGDTSTLVLQVEGDEPASAMTVGQPPAARVEAADAVLAGHIEVEVLYMPADDVQVYDLIVAPIGTLADTTADLSATVLPEGFVQRSLGIVTEGEFDILRLEIVAPAIFSDGFESGTTNAWSSITP